ncbi:MAG: hypothetical protein L3K00_03240 [Thermoplasmata archaeon]|nr:hypothetical protein [Thermoplasmata archaeon]
MRRGVAVAIAIVFLLTASAFLVLPAPVRAAPAHPSAPLPAATDTITTTNSGGGYDSTFYTGLSSGLVYFYATDGVDTSATIAINDYNATRDGLTNPVATMTAHFTAGVNYSYASNTRFALPLNLVWPGTWNITISGSTAGFSFQNFSVVTYYADTQANTSILLPGHSATIYYSTWSEVNDAPYNHAVTWTVDAQYETSTLTYIGLPGTPHSLGTAWNGTYSFTLPTNASANGIVEFHFWANTTGSSVWSVSTYPYIYIGELSAPTVTLSTCATGCYTDTFQSGSPIIATVTEWLQSAYYGGVRQPANGMVLSILYENGATPVTPAGTPPTKLSTNANGQAQWLFTADANTFSTTGANTLSVTPSDPAIPTNKGPATNTTFYILRSTAAAPSIQLVFNLAQYYGGDSIFANWTLTGNSSVTQGWNATEDQIWAYSSVGGYSWLVSEGGLNGTSGTIQFTAPMGLTGTIYIYLYASNATGSVYTYAYTSVSQPQILLSSNEPYYQAGDTVVVTVTTLGSVLSGATLESLVIDSNGDRLISGPMTGTTLTVAIPAKGAPRYIEFSVFAIGSTGATITNGTTYVYLATGYDLAVGVNTKSNYQDGSYQPGQTIQITYAITARGGTPMPKAWTIWVWPSSAWEDTGYGAVEMQTTASSGTISYTIPSNTPNGIQVIWVEAEPTTNSYSSDNSVSVNVQSNPSGLGLELGAGSGLTVGWLLLLIIVIVIGIVLFLAIRSHGRPKMMKPESGSPPSGGAPPQAWQEPASTTVPPAAASGGTPPESPPPPA